KERTKAEKMGVTFVEPNKAAFVEAVQPMYADLEKTNPELNELVEKIKAVK
ncbi:TRAP transporter substrate-binding protein, partial [Vibrio sp. Vb0932]|nr:TRAP transporter substrate-binding protein [Vibrio sp. Vb0932]